MQHTKDCPYLWVAFDANCEYGHVNKCVGLGNEGCLFKPVEEQSCETCAHNTDCPTKIECIEARIMHLIVRCSAYIKETKTWNAG